MELWAVVAVLGMLAAAAAAFVWLAWRLKDGTPDAKQKEFGQAAEQAIEHIFNDEFREELRNRGRLHFEKIIGENAMFLQQDLRLTTSQINEYMKAEITRTLQEAFAKYEESIGDAKQLALESINKTQTAIDQQRQMLSQELQKEVADEKARLLSHFETNMASIINHYVLAAVGNQIDLTDQLDYILSELQENKTAIIEDLKRGG